MLGEMFRKCGVPVHYSCEADNDDTLYAHAYARNAAVSSFIIFISRRTSCGLFDTVKILSGDRDMFRYNTRMILLIQSNLANLISS